MWVLIPLAVTGCATTDGSTWEEASAAPRGDLHLPTAAPPPEKVVGLDFEGEAFDEPIEIENPDLWVQVELELLRFSARRRALTKNNKPKDRWPGAMHTHWDRLLRLLEDGLQRKPGDALPTKRALIQARVTLDVEKELTERKFGACPADLDERLGVLRAWIAHHMRHLADDEQERHRSEGTLVLNWPVSPILLTSRFGRRQDPIHFDKVGWHSGVDLGGDKGDLVFSAAAGRVVFVGWKGGYGRLVVVQHAGGYQSTYGHLSRIVVELGTAVDAGSPVGLMGRSGRATGPHLHFEVRHGGKPINPLDTIGKRLDAKGPPRLSQIMVP